MEGLQSSLASADPIRLWLWGAFAVVATLYFLNKGLIAHLTRRRDRLTRDASGLRSWTPRRPPPWLTAWRRPKVKRYPGLLNKKQSHEQLRYFDRVRALAKVRPLEPANEDVLDELERLFRDLSLRDETQPAVRWAFKRRYRRALRYVVRLAQWSERYYQEPPRGVWRSFGPTLAPSALYAEAGALAHCMSDREALIYFEKARSLAPRWLAPLVILRHLYAAHGNVAALRSVGRDLIAALENEKVSYERMLEDEALPGKARWEVSHDINRLKDRIETERRALHLITIGRPE